MQSYVISLVLALGLLAYGLQTWIRSRQVDRASEKAWYSIEGRRIKRTALSLRFQAIVLFVVGGGALLWIALNARTQNRAEPTAPPVAATQQPVAPDPTLAPSDAFSTAAPGPYATVLASPSPTASEEDTPVWVPVPTLVLGSTAVVANTEGRGLWMRDAPFGEYMVLLEEGETVYVRGGLIEVDDSLWQGVTDAEGREGWVSADYLLYR